MSSTTTPTKVPPGKCLCGGIRLTFASDAQPIVGNCFCTHCSVGAGGPYQLNFTFDEAAVTVGGPEGLMVTYGISGCESGKPKPKSFCGRCGCTVFTKPKAYPGKVFVKGGLVDGGCRDFKPSIEAFTRSRPSFTAAVEGAAQYETEP